MLTEKCKCGKREPKYEKEENSFGETWGRFVLRSIAAVEDEQSTRPDVRCCSCGALCILTFSDSLHLRCVSCFIVHCYTVCGVSWLRWLVAAILTKIWSSAALAPKARQWPLHTWGPWNVKTSACRCVACVSEWPVCKCMCVCLLTGETKANSPTTLLVIWTHNAVAGNLIRFKFY